MARKYHAPEVPAVTSEAITKAQAALERASAALAEVEAADPSRDGWADRYNQVSGAHSAARRRLEMLEQLRARQLERGGQRQAAVEAAAGDLAALGTGLVAARDQVSAAAAGALRALAELAAAEARFNGLVAEGRARLAGLGLQIHDDLCDEGQFHAEGANGRGLRVDGADYVPLPVGGLTAHVLRPVYGDCRLHPLAEVWRRFRVHDFEVNGVRVPVLGANGKAGGR